MAFGKKGKSEGPGWRPAQPPKNPAQHGWQCPQCGTGGSTGGDLVTASNRADNHNQVKHKGGAVAFTYQTGR